MRSEKHIQHSRQSAIFLPWLSLAYAAVLPFAFDKGLAPISYLCSALLVGLIWLLLILKQWKSGNAIWYFLATFLLIVSHKITGRLLPEQIGIDYFLQWSFIVLSIVGFSVYLYRARILRYCKI
jgi:hypothetical protein